MTKDTPTPKELLDSGLARLETITTSAIILSEQNMGVEHTGRQNRSLFLFAKLIAHDMSILGIIRSYKRSRKGTALLDHFSVAALAPVVIDASLIIVYISHPSLSRNDWNLRRYVLYLHELTNRKRFLSASKRVDLPFFEGYREQKQRLNQKIRVFSKAAGISDEITSNLIKGQTVYVNGARGAAREAGWDLDFFEHNQSYLSAYVHSHPISFMRADEQKISFQDPSEFQLGFCGIALEIAAMYTEKAEQSMIRFSVSGMAGDPLGQGDE